MEEYNNIPEDRRENNPRPYVNNHLLLAILTTIFCCIPLGVVSIVYSVQSNNALLMGDVRMAQIKADKAKFWGIASIIACIVLAIFYFIFFGISVALGFAAQTAQGF